MLDALKFAAAAVGKRAFVPGATHFLIKDGYVRGTNGIISLAAPLPLGLECAPQAIPMVKAIANCEEATQLTLLPSGKLSVRSGGFKANIPCTDEIGAHTEPEGELIPIKGEELLKALRTVSPYMGTDAARRFSMSVLLKGGCAYATNNVTMVQYWFGTPFPLDAVLSSEAVEALCKIKETPHSIQVVDNSITFHYESGCWLKSTLMENMWPSTIDKILTVEGGNPQTVDPMLFDAMTRLKPFATDNGRIILEDGTMRTHLDESEGASCAIQDVSLRGCYAIDMLMLLKDNVDKADLTLYPKPCPFYGPNFRGVIVGQHI